MDPIRERCIVDDSGSAWVIVEATCPERHEVGGQLVAAFRAPLRFWTDEYRAQVREQLTGYYLEHRGRKH